LDLLARDDMKPLASLLHRAERGLYFGPDAVDAVQDRIAVLETLDGGSRTLELLTVLDRLGREEATPIAPPGANPRAGRDEQQKLHRALRLIHEDDQGEMTLADAAREVHMSVPTFTRFFRRMTGTTFVRYRNEWRVRKACTMLRDGDESITEVSLEAGFGNLSHFNRQFRRLMGTTPRQYRAACRE
jgi:AraC-like DNA-binding protein